MTKFLNAVFCLMSISSTFFLNEAFASNVLLSDLKNLRIDLKSQYVDIKIENNGDAQFQNSFVTSKLDKMDDATLKAEFETRLKLFNVNEMKEDGKQISQQYLFIPSILKGCEISGCRLYENNDELTGAKFKDKLNQILLEDDSQGILVKLPQREKLETLLKEGKSFETSYFIFGNFDKSEYVTLQVLKNTRK